MMKYFAINATSKVITDKVCVTLGASFYAGIAMDENGKYDRRHFYDIAYEISQNVEIFDKRPVDLEIWCLTEVPDYVEKECAIAENLRKLYFYKSAGHYEVVDWAATHVLKF